MLGLASLGKRIFCRRLDLRLTQKALANKLHVSPSQISKWENDITKPDSGSLLRLADMLRVSAEYLLFGPPPQPLSKTAKRLGGVPP